MSNAEGIDMESRPGIFPKEFSLEKVDLSLFIIALVGLLSRFLPDDNLFAAVIKVVFVSAVLGILPGALIVLAFKPLPRMTLLELIGIGIPVSLALVQFLTIASLIFHVSSSLMANALGILITVLAGALYVYHRRQPGHDNALWIERNEIIVGSLILLLAAILYVKGSPFFSDEDQIHISIVQRLAYLTEPRIDNFYVAPQVIYTHPFPGVQFFIALVSNLGDIDALFLYNKLRFFWGMATLVSLYLIARLVFRRPDLTLPVSITAVAFVLNGTFSDFPDIYWGQLTPYSHPSDIAMGVLLPGLLVLSMYFYEAKVKRSSIFFFVLSFSSGAALCVTHVREVVQFLVYNGSFFLAVIVFRGWQDRANRALLFKILVLSLCVVFATILYTSFYRQVVSHVMELDQEYKAGMLAHLQSLTVPGILNGALDTFYYIDWSIAYGWIPIILFISPILFFAFRKNILMLLVGASVFVYLLIFRLPILHIPYVYFTVFDILGTSARNVSFFSYLLAGASLYLLAVNLARVRSVPLAVIAAIAVSLCIGFVWKPIQKPLIENKEILFGPVLAMYLVVSVLMTKSNQIKLSELVLPENPSPSWRIIFATLVLCLAAVTFLRDRSPLSLEAVSTNLAPFPNRTKLFFTPRETLANLPCLSVDKVNLPSTYGGTPINNTLSCPPTYELITWARQALSPKAILAANAFNFYSPTTFIPHQISAWPAIASINLQAPQVIFPSYYAEFQRAMSAYGTQPFFNKVETFDERLKFVQTLKATHVLVDPMYYQQMKPTLAQWPTTFKLVYDDERWLVYEVDLK